jgi:hypothetical protein
MQRVYIGAPTAYRRETPRFCRRIIVFLSEPLQPDLHCSQLPILEKRVNVAPGGLILAIAALGTKTIRRPFTYIDGVGDITEYRSSIPSVLIVDLSTSESVKLADPFAKCLQIQSYPALFPIHRYVESKTHTTLQHPHSNTSRGYRFTPPTI